MCHSHGKYEFNYEALHKNRPGSLYNLLKILYDRSALTSKLQL